MTRGGGKKSYSARLLFILDSVQIAPCKANFGRLRAESICTKAFKPCTLIVSAKYIQDRGCQSNLKRKEFQSKN